MQHNHDGRTDDHHNRRADDHHNRSGNHDHHDDDHHHDNNHNDGRSDNYYHSRRIDHDNGGAGWLVLHEWMLLRLHADGMRRADGHLVCDVGSVCRCLQLAHDQHDQQHDRRLLADHRDRHRSWTA